MKRWQTILIAAGLAAGCAPSNTEVNDNLPRAPEGVTEGGAAPEAPTGGGGMPGMSADSLPSNYPGIENRGKPDANVETAKPEEGQAEEPDAGADPKSESDPPVTDTEAPAEPTPPAPTP